MGFTASIKFGCHGHFSVLRALLGSCELRFLVKELAFIGEANQIVSKVGKVTNLLSRVVFLLPGRLFLNPCKYRGQTPFKQKVACENSELKGARERGRENL